MILRFGCYLLSSQKIQKKSSGLQVGCKFLTKNAHIQTPALALVPFDRNIGSASAMLGFLQIGVAGLASASIGIFNSHTMMPVALILAATSWIGSRFC